MPPALKWCQLASQMICVVRPYANLPSDGAGNDRYVNLSLELRARGIDARLLCSNFVHNRKTKRSMEQVLANRRALPFVVEFGSVGYTRNTSIRRVLYEVLFGIRALCWVVLNRPRTILVGEPLFFVGWLLVLYGMLCGARICADVIDLWPEADTRPLNGLGGAAVRLLYRALKWSRTLRFRQYSSVSFVSRSYASVFRLPRESPVFYWGSNLLPERVVTKNRHITITIVYAGSFGDGYDIQTVLEAARLLAAHERPQFRFLIAGGGTQEPLVRESARRGEVSYVGYIERQELIDLYTTADIGLLPYKANSIVAMPIKFFDYVNFGVFAISSLKLEVAEVIESNRIGLSYKAGDAQDLCDRILDASMDPDRLDRVRSVCTRLAKYYSIPCQYGGFAEFIAKDVGF
jgi:glycosyltransferase involved in cell wall biosynthesis